jgi:hypothetical protein
VQDDHVPEIRARFQERLQPGSLGRCRKIGVEHEDVAAIVARLRMPSLRDEIVIGLALVQRGLAREQRLQGRSAV